jgi:hypothetical protein
MQKVTNNKAFSRFNDSQISENKQAEKQQSIVQFFLPLLNVHNHQT